MRKGGGFWKWQIVLLVQLVFLLNGVKMQKPQSRPNTQQEIQREVRPKQEPQVYWATSIDSSGNSNRRFQQANEWSAVVNNNYLDRQWPAHAPAPEQDAPNQPHTQPSPPSPPAQAYQAAPAPAPAPAQAPVPAPAPPSYPAPTPAPPVYPELAPPAYPEPAPPAYPEPAPPAYPEPAPPAYPEPAPPAYPEQAPPAYDPRVPSYAPPPSPPAYYYPAPQYYPPPQYYPVKQESKGPSFKDLLSKEKEAIKVMLSSDSEHNKLTYEQKIWLSILSPVIIVALVVPLAAILFSGFTITTTKRAFGELDLDAMKKNILEIGERYTSVLESDECMQRIICDLGSYAKALPGKSYILTILANFVPDTMKNNMAIFQKAANFGPETAQCGSFKCSAWKY